MDKGSVWHWLVALVVFCVPILLLVRYRQPRTAAVATAPPTGIGGWLALFAFILCAWLHAKRRGPCAGNAGLFGRLPE